MGRTKSQGSVDDESLFVCIVWIITVEVDAEVDTVDELVSLKQTLENPHKLDYDRTAVNPPACVCVLGLGLLSS